MNKAVIPAIHRFFIRDKKPSFFIPREAIITKSTEGKTKNTYDHLINIPNPALMPKAIDQLKFLKLSVSIKQYILKVTMAMRAKSKRNSLEYPYTTGYNDKIITANMPTKALCIRFPIRYNDTISIKKNSIFVITETT